MSATRTGELDHGQPDERGTLARVGSRRYDAFISYSHRADLDLAPSLRDGLQKLAKPWNRRRALSVFLDQSSLEVSHELGGSLEERIDDTRWLILLMSEASAGSDWVGAEIAAWSGAVGKERMALVLTSGTIVWDPVRRDFDYDASTAVHERMRGVYTGQDSEPLYLDMTWTKGHGVDEKLLDLDNARFRDAIATIAAPIHGRSKDELEGEDIRQHRRFVLARRLAFVVLTIVTLAAIVGFVLALIQRSEAIDQRERAASRAVAADALVALGAETDLSALLALEGVRIRNTTDARGGLVSVLSQPSRFLQRTDVHDAPITAIAFDERGTIAVTADELGTIRIWDVADDPAVVPQAAVRDDVISVGREVADVFVVDDEAGTYLIVFDSGGGITYVDLATPDELDPIPPPDELLIGAVANDGVHVAGIDLDGTLVIYEFSDDGATYEFVPVAEHAGAVDVGERQGPPDLVFSDDAEIVAWSDGGGFAVWHWRSGEPGRRTTESAVTSIGISPGGSVVAVGEKSGNLHLYDGDELGEGSPADPMPVDEVFDLAFKPNVDDGGTLTLASAHGNGDVVLWAVVDDPGAPPVALWDDELVGHLDEARQVAFAPDGRIASSDFEGEVIWWNDVPVSFLGSSWYPDGGGGDMLESTFTAPGRFLTIDVDGGVWHVDVETDEITRVDDLAPATALDAAEGTVVVGNADGSIDVASAAGEPRGTLEASDDSSPVVHVRLSADGELVLVVTGTDEVSIWDLTTMSPLGTPDLPDGFVPDNALFDGGTVWIGGQDADDRPIAIQFDAATGQRLREPIRHSDRQGNLVTAMAISADGRLLATGSTDRRIQLFDTDSLEPRGEAFAGHRGRVTGILFWDDDETLISSDGAGALIMWDVSGREQVARLGGPSDGLNSLDVDPVGELLLAAGEDDASWTWTLDQERWRDRACQLANRNMTDSEWELFGDGTTKVRHCPDLPVEGDAQDADYDDALSD